MPRELVLSVSPADGEGYRKFEAAKKMRLNGSTLAEIAAEIGVSIDTVARVLKKDPECAQIRVNTGRKRRLEKQARLSRE